MLYPIIYADPAWLYRTWSRNCKQKTAFNHYDLMDLQAIKSLPVNEISAKDAVLLIWATFPLLPEALEVINAWGFEYKTVGFVWVKRNKKNYTWFWGLGYYTRANAEVCLIATKGKGLKRKFKNVHSIIDTPIEEHSKKPDVTRKRFVKLFGDLPRIELFARQKAKGWDCLGNEIDGRDIRDSLQELVNDNQGNHDVKKVA